MMNLTHFQWYCQKVLPLVYDESLSYYEVLCKLTEFIQELAKSQTTVEDLVNSLQTSFEELQSQFANFETDWSNFQQQVNQNQTNFENTVNQSLQEMSNTLDAIKNGEYSEFYDAAIKAYIDQNLQTMVSTIVKYVSFGITKDGYFAAYIPESWDFLSFNTITDETSPLYGHLVLQW